MAPIIDWRRFLSTPARGVFISPNQGCQLVNYVYNDFHYPMKKEIHPKYHEKAHVHCACGNTFTIGSTSEKIEVEICSKCHPFYTGEEKLIDTAGRVEKFKTRREKAAATPKKEKKVRVKKTK